MIIVLTVIALALTLLFRWQDQNQAETPFFQYRYDAQTDAIDIDTTNDFDVSTIQWYVPNATGTSTGQVSGGEMAIEDIVSAAEENLPSGEYSYTYPNSLDGYVRCQLLNQFTLDDDSTSTQPLDGYPIMVRTFYTYKGALTEPKEDLGVIWLSETSLNTPVVSSVDNLSSSDWNILLASGDREWARVLQRIPFDSQTKYLTDDGHCMQMGYSVPTVHVNPS